MNEPVRSDGRFKESQVDLAEPHEVRVRVWIADNHDQCAGDVVDAVPVVRSGRVQERVLEDAAAVGERVQVVVPIMLAHYAAAAVV